MFGFFKPKWQHRNPKIRITTIQEGCLDKELILKIAQTDKELMVRIAAIEKINELNLLYALFLQEPCANGKEAILKQISQVISQSENSENLLHNFLNTTVRRDFPIADLLIASDSSAVKKLLFPLINPQKDLPKLIDVKYVFTPDELSLIDNMDVLVALVRDPNVTDKKILTHLKELIKSREEVARKTALQAELLSKYEALASTEPLPALNVFSDLEKEWATNHFGDENVEYKNRYLEKYQAHNIERQNQLSVLERIKVELEETDNPQNILSELNELVISHVFSTKEKKEIQLLIQQVEIQQAELKRKAQESAIKAKLNDNVKKNGTLKVIDRVIFDHEKFNQLSEKLEQLLDEGSLQAAKVINDEMQSLVNGAQSIKDKNHYGKILKQLAQPLYDRLDVARWSTHQAFEKLCNDAEVLLENASADLLSNQLKQLRENWEAAKKSVVKAPHALHKRFEDACKKIHERVVAERSVKSAVREGYVKEAQDLLDTLSQFINKIDWSNPNWASLLETRSTFLQEWNKYLNQYSTDGALSYGEPLFLNRDKQKLEKLMRQTLKPLDLAIQEERLKEKKRREDEIQILQKLLADNQLQEAIEKAKLFSKTFSPTVRLKHQEENLLWKQLRLVNDEIFSKREDLYSAEEQEKAENLKQKQALLSELKTLYVKLQENAEIKGEALTLLHNINNAWRNIGMIEKNSYLRLENELKSIEKKIRDKIADIEQQQDNQQRTALLCLSYDLGKIEHQAVNENDFEIAVDYYENTDSALRKRLKCLEQIKVGLESARQFLINKINVAEEEALNLVVLREILLNIPSPEKDQGLRLQKQAELLEHAMTNNFDDQEKDRQLKELDEQWFENVVGIIPDELYQRFR